MTLRDACIIGPPIDAPLELNILCYGPEWPKYTTRWLPVNVRKVIKTARVTNRCSSLVDFNVQLSPLLAIMGRDYFNTRPQIERSTLSWYLRKKLKSILTSRLLLSGQVDRYKAHKVFFHQHSQNLSFRERCETHLSQYHVSFKHTYAQLPSLVPPPFVDPFQQIYLFAWTASSAPIFFWCIWAHDGQSTRTM